MRARQEYCRRAADPSYLSDVLTVSNLVLTAVPTPFTAATITMPMPIAMRQYSIAVAPDSSLKKLFNNRRMKKLLSTLPGFFLRHAPNGTLDWND
jgi:hypothetical protein